MNNYLKKFVNHLVQIRSPKDLYQLFKLVYSILLGDKIEASISYWCICRLKRKCYISGKKINVVYLLQEPVVVEKFQFLFERLNQEGNIHFIFFTIPLHELSDKDWGADIAFDFLKNYSYEYINARKQDGSWVSLKGLHPDYVFYQRPYNIHLPKIYRSNRVVRYAKICYVPYAYKVATNNIGLTRDFIKDVYFYYAANDIEVELVQQKVRHKETWAKVYDLGYPSLEKVCFLYESIGQDVMSARTAQKLLQVIWTPRWTREIEAGKGHFLEYKDEFLKFAKRNEEISFVFRPHPLTFQNMIEKGYMTETEVTMYKMACHEQSNVELDESHDYLLTFIESDILVCDISSIIIEFFLTGKPIIYCRSDIEKTSDFAQISETFYVCNTWEEIEKNLILLLSGIDPLKSMREQCAKEYRKRVRNSSAEIVRSLLDDYRDHAIN